MSDLFAYHDTAVFDMIGQQILPATLSFKITKYYVFIVFAYVNSLFNEL